MTLFSAPVIPEPTPRRGSADVAFIAPPVAPEVDAWVLDEFEESS